MLNFTTLHQICPVGLSTVDIVSGEGIDPVCYLENPYGFAYRRGEKAELMTRESFNLANIEQFYALQKWDFFLGCTKDGGIKIVYNIAAIIGNVCEAVYHLLLTLPSLAEGKQAALTRLKLVGVRLSMCLSNCNEIIRNILRAIPFIGHVLGCHYARFATRICEYKYLKRALTCKFIFEYNTLKEQTDAQERLSITPLNEVVLIIGDPMIDPHSQVELTQVIIPSLGSKLKVPKGVVEKLWDIAF